MSASTPKPGVVVAIRVMAIATSVVSITLALYLVQAASQLLQFEKTINDQSLQMQLLQEQVQEVRQQMAAMIDADNRRRQAAEKAATKAPLSLGYLPIQSKLRDALQLDQATWGKVVVIENEMSPKRKAVEAELAMLSPTERLRKLAALNVEREQRIGSVLPVELFERYQSEMRKAELSFETAARASASAVDF